MFEQIKEVVTIQMALSQYTDVEPNRYGKVRCPLHNEKSASFKIYENNTFYCFGCGAGGDVVKFVQLLMNVSARDAADILEGDFGISGHLSKYELFKAQRKHAQERNEKETNKKIEQDAMNVLGEYHQCLWNNLPIKGCSTLTDDNMIAVRDFKRVECICDYMLYASTAERMIWILDNKKYLERLKNELATLSNN